MFPLTSPYHSETHVYFFHDSSEPSSAVPVFEQGLVDIVRHVIKRSLNPRGLSQMASYDLASNICRALPSNDVHSTSCH